MFHFGWLVSYRYISITCSLGKPLSYNSSVFFLLYCNDPYKFLVLGKSAKVWSKFNCATLLHRKKKGWINKTMWLRNESFLKLPLGYSLLFSFTFFWVKNEYLRRKDNLSATLRDKLSPFLMVYKIIFIIYHHH